MKEIVATIGLVLLALLCFMRPETLSRDHVTFVYDLPDTNQFSVDGHYYDLGWKHRQGRVFRIPISGTVEGQYVLFRKVGRKSHLFDLDESRLRTVARSANIEIADFAPIGQFDNYWGWLLLLLLPLWALTKRFILP